LHEQPSKSSYLTTKKTRNTNIDLCLDKSIYPCDPYIGKNPNFSFLKGLLEIVGDGENGLFKYIQSLTSHGLTNSHSGRIQKIAIYAERTSATITIRNRVQTIKLG